MSVPIRDAATVLALREDESRLEVFMVRRDSRLGFLGGAHVFPGGAVDDGDRTEAAHTLLIGIDEMGAMERLHDDPAQARALLIAATASSSRKPASCSRATPGDDGST